MWTTASQRVQLAKAWRWVSQIEEIGTRLRQCSMTELAERFKNLRGRAKAEGKRERLLPEVYAIVVEVSARTLMMRHFPVQLLAGALLSQRGIVQMDTGEGKTLTASLPLTLLATKGNGVLLATANDYLARRDMQAMEPIFTSLGLTVGVIQSDSEESQRRSAYWCDITYGTANQFAFDYMRDRAKRRGSSTQIMLDGTGSQRPVGRKGLHAIIVDEADSLLIDEASTPLVIAAPLGETSATPVELYRWAATHAPTALKGEHFLYNRNTSNVELTERGQAWVRGLARPPSVSAKGLIVLYQHLERAIHVLHYFHKKEHYVIEKNELTIVDERTGRLGHGRQWQHGIHQAIQAKERLEITPPNGQLARMTIQSFFSSFRHVSGMTGTALEARREFKKVYNLGVVAVPRHKPNCRTELPPIVVATEDEKFQAIVSEVKRMVSLRRATLIGTRTIEISLLLSEYFAKNNIDHQLLNASQTEHEADLIKMAGEECKVTIATNMAGRGTDIQLSPVVSREGGLHVIVTELHDTSRVDYQLIGRSARKGEPGTYRFILSLEDEVLKRRYGTEIPRRFLRANYPKTRFRTLLRAQRFIARQNELKRTVMQQQEIKRLKAIWRSGLDPLLDVCDN